MSYAFYEYKCIDTHEPSIHAHVNLQTMASSSSGCNIDDSSSDTELRTPKKKRYKRSLHHGLSRRMAVHHKHVPPRITNSSSNFALTIETDNNIADISSSSPSDYSDLQSSSDISTSDTSSICSSTSEDEHPLKYEKAAEPEEDRPLYDGSYHTAQSSSTAIMLFVMKHSLSREAFSDLLLLISSHLPETTFFTKSVYKLKETLKSSIGFQEPIVHHYCQACQMLCQDENTCNNVDCQRNNSKTLEFHDLQIEEQLKTMFKGLWFAV